MTTYIPQLALPAAIFDKPAVAVLLPVTAGMAVGFMTRPQTDSKYRTLQQPRGSPPAWVFGPVWTLLYAAMGYASYRAWAAGTSSFDPHKLSLAKQGATLYTVQLGLNLVWTPLFFGLGRPLAATFDIIALTGVVGYLAKTWAGVDETAAWLMAPYLGWLSFATYLTIASGYLNNWDLRNIGKSPKSE